MFNTKLLRAGFNKTTATYKNHDVLFKEIGNRLLERLTLIKGDPKIILEIGVRDGECLTQLSNTYKQAKIIATDIAENRLTSCKAKHLDNENILFVQQSTDDFAIGANSVDMVFANLSVYWANNLSDLFKNLKIILKPNGILLFSSFGPDTLRELKQSWKSTSEDTHVMDFMDMHHIGDLLLKTGFSLPVVDIDRVTLSYKNCVDLLHDLKFSGEKNYLNARKKTLLSTTKFRNMCQHYQDNFSEDKKCLATFEVIYGYAKLPQQSSATKINSNEIRVNVSDIVRKSGGF